MSQRVNENEMNKRLQQACKMDIFNHLNQSKTIPFYLIDRIDIRFFFAVIVKRHTFTHKLMQKIFIYL